MSAAHIGVGMAGVEGGQAVQNSDFALSQFRFLQRLLLVHGRWSYRRMSLFLRYFMFKTGSFALTQMWFGFFNGFSAQVRVTPANPGCSIYVCARWDWLETPSQYFFFTLSCFAVSLWDVVHRLLHRVLHINANCTCGLLWTGDPNTIKKKCIFVFAVLFFLHDFYLELFVFNFLFICWSRVSLPQDVSAESSLKFPQLYRSGQKQELFSPLVLLTSFLHAIYASLVYFFIPYGVFYDSALGYQTMAVTISLSALFGATTEVRIAACSHDLRCCLGWGVYWHTFLFGSSICCFAFFSVIHNRTGLFEVITALLLIKVPFLCKSYRPLRQYTADRITRRLIPID